MLELGKYLIASRTTLQGLFVDFVAVERLTVFDVLADLCHGESPQIRQSSG